MAKGQIHINKKGEPARCTAKIKCKLNPNDPHFHTIEEARTHIEQENSLKYDGFNSNPISKNAVSEKSTISNFAINKDAIQLKLSEEEFEKLHKAQTEILAYYSKQKLPIPQEFMEDRKTLINEVVARGLASGLDTESKYTFINAQNEKEYTPERQKLHAIIISEILENAKNIPNEGKVLWTGGVMAAGKTYVLETKMKGLANNYVSSLNPDEIKIQMAKMGMMPKVEGLTPMEVQSLAHNEASYLTRKITTIFSKEKKNILLDGTLRNYDAVSNVITNMKSDGYEIKNTTVVFVEADKVSTSTRALSRYKEGLDNYTIHGKGYGGRYVAQEAIESMYEESGKSATLTNARKLYANGFFSSAQFYSNGSDGLKKISDRDKNLK